jgi:hypothetical protein
VQHKNGLQWNFIKHQEYKQKSQVPFDQVKKSFGSGSYDKVDRVKQHSGRPFQDRFYARKLYCDAGRAT